MSTFSCPLVEIGKVGSHPQADTLEITHIAKYPVIVKMGQFKEGDRAIYIPEEALVPNVPMFQFLWTKRIEQKDIEGNILSVEMRVEENPPERHRVIWAKKLRGIFSMGLLVPVPVEFKDLPLGTDLSKQLGIEKYEKPEMMNTGGDNVSPPGWFHKYTEIEHLRKYDYVLLVGEEVVITEKIHGCNGRFCYNEEQLWVGSHANTKKDDGKSGWWRVANELKMEERLKSHPGIIFYGEVYGQVQKGFDYGIRRGTFDFILFDAFSLADNKYLDEDQFLALANSVDLKVVPTLYRGPWLGLEAHEALADGPNNLNGKHIREGFVVKPTTERWNPEVGRVILKLVGQEWLLKKGKG
jgi:RNA ligase (TIGR02306 family)